MCTSVFNVAVITVGKMKSTRLGIVTHICYAVVGKLMQRIILSLRSACADRRIPKAKV